ncbi:hypothetical protein EVAR_35926_1 [Eumeta japonica]|uniref:Uncharacterized protein n=1 Tax=Eumeta variegata TaxID=151549 RepID=A0A4C1W577_EUMVA|nr:hypothetical protein EVAR_35926_1 [Eumeta japonica]
MRNDALHFSGGMLSGRPLMFHSLHTRKSGLAFVRSLEYIISGLQFSWVQSHIPSLSVRFEPIMKDQEARSSRVLKESLFARLCGRTQTTDFKSPQGASHAAKQANLRDLSKSIIPDKLQMSDWPYSEGGVCRPSPACAGPTPPTLTLTTYM